ncbi:hypothetical protein [Micrococcus luteus]|nr:hypothetical protein [Micrococcus luteus]
MTTWYTPAPGTAEHRVRSMVRAVVWGIPPTVLLVLSDPAVRTTLGLPA